MTAWADRASEKSSRLNTFLLWLLLLLLIGSCPSADNCRNLAKEYTTSRIFKRSVYEYFQFFSYCKYIFTLIHHQNNGNFLSSVLNFFICLLVKHFIFSERTKIIIAQWTAHPLRLTTAGIFDYVNPALNRFVNYNYCSCNDRRG